MSTSKTRQNFFWAGGPPPELNETGRILLEHVKARVRDQRMPSDDYPPEWRAALEDRKFLLDLVEVYTEEPRVLEQQIGFSPLRGLIKGAIS